MGINDDVVLTCDSPCDINLDLKERYDIQLFPYHINLNDHDYIDNVTITPEMMFDAYYENGSLPMTSASSPEDYRQFFEQFTSQGKRVLHISLGGALTCGCANAALAADMLEGVYTIDSFNLSGGSTQITIRAARMLNDDIPLEEVVRRCKETRACLHSSFIVDTMDFLAAGGRCPALVAQMGKALKFKPSLTVDNTDGSVNLGKMYRGKLKKCVEKYTQDALEAYDDIMTDDIFIAYSSSREFIPMMKEIIHEKIPNVRIHVVKASSTISTHCGPNTVGLMFATKTPSA